MPAYDDLAVALDERTIAQRVGLPHDEARLSAPPLRSNVVETFDEYRAALGGYCAHHFNRCITPGGRMSPAEAQGIAQEILEREYRRHGGTIVSAYNDAHEGTNGGLRVQLDTICEALKLESVERYVREAFNRYVAPNSWEKKVEIIRQFFEKCGASLSSSIDINNPARYAQNYQELIQSYVRSLQSTSSVFRRL
jgi:hypothetical protein